MNKEDYLKAFVVVTSENEKLQSRIDKAIEYIDSLWLDDSGKILEIKERLHFILKGSDIND